MLSGLRDNSNASVGEVCSAVVGEPQLQLYENKNVRLLPFK